MNLGVRSERSKQRSNPRQLAPGYLKFWLGTAPLVIKGHALDDEGLLPSAAHKAS